MRLKRIELFGFKSFADRTVLDFANNSLTGIVGPNGCGKSNVVDSIRWVLGETRPTSMRGAGMTDVIFKGSVSRPPLSVAEVTLVLDNTDERLSDRGAEVSVTRRLFKTGEGEYLIDGERVRLKDVREMLFDTGLGSRGYSVLEQGRIDAVLSANPVQRRAIFEEAAGISRYRQRRHETELRLKRVETDMTRLDDVVGELRTRVRSLKIQAGRAERFVEAKAEWTTQKSRLFKHRLHTLEQDLQEAAPEVLELDEQLGTLREERASCERDVHESEEERAAVVAELDRVSTEAGRLSGEVRAMDERKSQLAIRVASWEASASEEAERAASLGSQLEERQAELEGMQGEAEELNETARLAEDRARALLERMRELGARYKTVRDEVQAQNDLLLERLHERTEGQNRVRHLTEARAPMSERHERVATRLAGLDESLAEVASTEESARAEVTAAEAALEAAETARRDHAARLAVIETDVENTKRAKAVRELDRARVQSRIESLLDRERELDDLAAGAKSVLSAAGNPDGPCSPERLRGLVADHLRADTRLARALDAALADRAVALVAADAASARGVAEWLAGRSEGQAGIVVPEGLARIELAPLPELGPGALGRLSELVECAPELQGLADALLGSVIVAADLDTALALVAEHPRFAFVTPEGELVDAAGIVGGHREVTQGAVGRRSTAADLESEVTAADEGIAALEERLAVLGGDRSKVAADLGASDEAREARRAALSEAGAALHASEARLVDLTASRLLVAQEAEKAAEEEQRLERELAEAREQRVERDAAFERENARLAEMEAGRHALEEQREALGREANTADVEQTARRGELDAMLHRIEVHRQRMEEGAAEIERSETRSRNYAENARQGTEEGEAIAVVATDLLQQRAAVDERLEELRAFERQGRERIETVRQKAEAVQSKLDAKNDRLSDRKLLVQRLELAREDVVKRSEEDLGLGLGDLRAEFEPDPELADAAALEALDSAVAELKAQLDKLGPVNMDAVEELEEVGGRLEFLETQSGDLAKARKTLAETIQRMDEESRRLFLETFDEVRVNFQRVFRQLFGGGRADVQLEEGVDVLEAGIEIVARPPGRELLPIGLLSGGQRTMTALALLFAVFEARPSPFCVLDEVDAALDDANIDRFIGMLEGFRSDTQFIVVTHNKGTMAVCESLFGITMEVKGVSRFVMVELDDVDEFVPDVDGGARQREDSSAPSADAAGEDEEGDETPASPAALDAESGEPVVEIQPARAEPSDGTSAAASAKTSGETSDEELTEASPEQESEPESESDPDLDPDLETAEALS